MFKRYLFARLMEAAGGDAGGAGGAGGDTPPSGDVTYSFGEGVTPEQATVLTGHAKELGLTPEQAPKYAAHFAKLQAASAPPEAYKFAQVDGKDLPAEIATELSTTAKALGLNAEQAQKFADYELQLRKESDAETAAALKKTQQGWRDAAKADKDIGGAAHEANLAQAKRALEKFFPGIAKNQPGFPFLDHPEVVRGLVTIGKSIGEDGDFVRSGNSTGAADPAKVMFPSMT
jgi:hypothetical protein